MKRTILLGFVVVLFVFLGTGCTTTSPAEPETMTEQPSSPTQGEPTAEGMMMDELPEVMGDVPIEALFIDGMIPHHQLAVEMAQQALEEAEHEELRQIAQQIIEAQQAEIEQLQQWREEWYPDIEPSMGMQMDGMLTLEDMMLSTDESIPFDLRFVDAMIIHHGGAITMAQQLLGVAERQELRRLAQEIIDAQQAEIEQLRQWREEWYPETP